MASSVAKHGQENDIIIGSDNSTGLGHVKGKKGDDEKITEESKEDEAIDWEEGGVEDEDARVELGLVARIWTNRNINVKSFMATIKNIWHPKHGLDISATGNNVFVFQCYHWKEKQRVLEGQPWHFDRHAIILDEINGAIKPSNMELYAFPMWVRVYNLPFKGRLNTANVETIGNKICSFVKMDAMGSVGIDKLIRLRIMVDV